MQSISWRLAGKYRQDQQRRQTFRPVKKSSTPQTVFTYMGRRGSGSIFLAAGRPAPTRIVVPHGE